jgi:hypothetical protein
MKSDGGFMISKDQLGGIPEVLKAGDYSMNTL